MLRAPPQRAPPDAPPDTIASPPDTIAPPGDGAPLSAVELDHQRIPSRSRWREALLSPAATVAAMVGLGVLTLSPTLSTTLTLIPSPNQVALGVLLAWAAEAMGSSALLGAFVAGTSSSC